MNLPPDIVSSAEAAARLGVTRQTVWTYIRTGHLIAKKLGRSWRISRKSLDALMRAPDAKQEDNADA